LENMMTLAVLAVLEPSESGHSSVGLVVEYDQVWEDYLKLTSVV
jgi:hypothetical protein